MEKLKGKDMELLKAEIRARLPTARCEWDLPVDPSAAHFLDVQMGGTHVVIEIRPERGYGVSRITEKAAEETAFTGPDKVFELHEREDMIQYLVALFQAN